MKLLEPKAICYNLLSYLTYSDGEGESFDEALYEKDDDEDYEEYDELEKDEDEEEESED